MAQKSVYKQSTDVWSSKVILSEKILSETLQSGQWGTESFLPQEHLSSNNTGNWKQVLFYMFHRLCAHHKSFYRNL